MIEVEVPDSEITLNKVDDVMEWTASTTSLTSLIGSTFEVDECYDS